PRVPTAAVGTAFALPFSDSSRRRAEPRGSQVRLRSAEHRVAKNAKDAKDARGAPGFSLARKPTGLGHKRWGKAGGFAASFARHTFSHAKRAALPLPRSARSAAPCGCPPFPHIPQP